MEKMNLGISIFIAVVLTFAVLFAAEIALPLGSLLIFLLLLNIAVVWMVITIIKNRETGN